MERRGSPWAPRSCSALTSARLPLAAESCCATPSHPRVEGWGWDPPAAEEEALAAAEEEEGPAAGGGEGSVFAEEGEGPTALEGCPSRSSSDDASGASGLRRFPATEESALATAEEEEGQAAEGGEGSMAVEVGEGATAEGGRVRPLGRFRLAGVG